MEQVHAGEQYQQLPAQRRVTAKLAQGEEDDQQPAEQVLRRPRSEQAEQDPDREPAAGPIDDQRQQRPRQPQARAGRVRPGRARRRRANRAAVRAARMFTGDAPADPSRRTGRLSNCSRAASGSDAPSSDQRSNSTPRVRSSRIRSSRSIITMRCATRSYRVRAGKARGRQHVHRDHPVPVAAPAQRQLDGLIVEQAGQQVHERPRWHDRWPLVLEGHGRWLRSPRSPAAAARGGGRPPAWAIIRPRLERSWKPTRSPAAMYAAAIELAASRAMSSELMPLSTAMLRLHSATCSPTSSRLSMHDQHGRVGQCVRSTHVEVAGALAAACGGLPVDPAQAVTGSEWMDVAELAAVAGPGRLVRAGHPLQPPGQRQRADRRLVGRDDAARRRSAPAAGSPPPHPRPGSGSRSAPAPAGRSAAAESLQRGRRPAARRQRAPAPLRRARCIAGRSSPRAGRARCRGCRRPRIRRESASEQRHRRLLVVRPVAGPS